MSIIIRNRYVIGLMLVIISSLALRHYFIHKEPYWLDEAYTSWFASQSFYNLVFWIPTFESHPPFYYLLIKLWNGVLGHYLEHSERYLSLALSIPLIYLPYKILRKINSDNPFAAGFLIVFLFGFSPIVSWYSLEARPYLLFMLSYAIALYGFVLVITEGDDRFGRTWMIFSVGVLLTNWCHNLGPVYSFVFYALLLFHCLFVKDLKKLKNVFRSATLVMVFSLPLLVTLLFQLQGWSSGSWIQEPDLNAFFLTLKNLFFPLNHVHDSLVSRFVSHAYIGKGLSDVINLSFPALFAFGIFASLKEKNLIFFYLMFLIFSIPVISYIVSAMGPNVFLERTFTPILVPYYIFLALSLSRIQWPVVKYACLSVLFFQLCYGSFYHLKYRDKEPWDDIRDFIYHQSDVDTLVLLFPNSIKLPLLKDGSEVLNNSAMESIPYEFPALDKSTFYPAGTPSVPGFTAEDVSRFDELTKEGHNRIILITRREALYDPNGLLKIAFKKSDYELVMTKSYDTINIYKYDLSGSQL